MAARSGEGNRLIVLLGGDRAGVQACALFGVRVKADQ